MLGNHYRSPSGCLDTRWLSKRRSYILVIVGIFFLFLINQHLIRRINQPDEIRTRPDEHNFDIIEPVVVDRTTGSNNGHTDDDHEPIDPVPPVKDDRILTAPNANPQIPLEDDSVDDFKSTYERRKNELGSTFGVAMSEESMEFLRYIQRDVKRLTSFKGIIVFPYSTEKVIQSNEQQQQQQQQQQQRHYNLLMAFAQAGYLALYATSSPNIKTFGVSDKNPNMFLYHGRDFEKHLLPFLRNQHIIVLCNSWTQLAFIDELQHKFVWFDIESEGAIERKNPSAITEGEGSLDYLLEARRRLAKTANVVSYSPLEIYSKLAKIAPDNNFYYLPPAQADASSAKHWATHAAAIEKLVQDSFMGLKVYANPKDAGVGHVAVMMWTFLESSGQNFYSGGAERYIIDLAALCERLNLTLTAYQFGEYQWVRRFRNFDVVSLLKPPVLPDGTPIYSTDEYAQLFYDRVMGRASLTMYSAFFLAHPLAAKPSIGISHGVAWDSENVNHQDGTSFWASNEKIIKSARGCDKMVSVDTNSASWFQTIDFNLGQQMQVIPNYVDTEVFKPRPDFDKLGERILIIYPRRLYKPRGLYMVLQILSPLLREHPEVDFHFVGKGFKWDTKHVKKKMRRWKGRVKWYSLPPERMWQAYVNADISLVPTLWSEGTSLSCLEAMASGNAVISTRVGGLTDLVFDDYNGFLIDPNPEALLAKIKELLNDRKKLVEFKRRAVDVARAFSKNKWDRSWTQVIEKTKDNSLVETAKAIAKQDNGGKSTLIELFLTEEQVNEHRMKQLIVKLLMRNALVYIRVKDQPLNKQNSFGRLQWVPWSDERHASHSIVVVESSLVNELKNQQPENPDNNAYVVVEQDPEAEGKDLPAPPSQKLTIDYALQWSNPNWEEEILQLFEERKKAFLGRV